MCPLLVNSKSPGPNRADAHRPVLELLHRRDTGQAVPDVYHSSRRPVCRQLGQPRLVTEALRVRYSIGLLNRRVKGDVIRFVLDGKYFHLLVLLAASAAVITFITRLGNTSKRIMKF